MLYLQGDLDGTEQVLRRAVLAADDRALDRDQLADHALVAAWAATVDWARGRAASGSRTAVRALHWAEASDQPRALAAAYTVLALLGAAEGDRRRNDRQYALALEAAVRAQDRTQLLRIHVNLASQRMEEGDLPGALTELDAALAVADAPAGRPHPTLVGLAQVNRATVLMRTGRLAAARESFRQACTILQRTGTHFLAHALGGLAETYELQGDLHQAHASYEEAVLVARQGGDVHALVPALAGRARLFAAQQDRRAERAATEAVDAATGLTEVTARNAAGWAALSAAAPEQAQVHADTAMVLARARRDRSGLAESLELSACAGSPAVAGPLLADAIRVWDDLGDPVGAARAEFARARFGAGRTPAAAAVTAQRRLRSLGVDPAVGTRSLARIGVPPRAVVSVQLFGSFAVLRDSNPVPPAAWQSRKARDLLKLLVLRRGRPVTRDALGELLWPGQLDTANRLSVALSVVRGVLDPERSAPADTYVRADAAGVSYDRRALAVDVDAFLQLAAAGSAAVRTDRLQEARVLLEAAETSYLADVLDDEPDLEDAAPLREEVRAAHLAVNRALGGVCASLGDVDGAVMAWLHLLEQDPYDEDGALRLVELLISSGRHGEAQRHHRRYVQRMDDLGVPAAPMFRAHDA